jgi:hypothetical protein
MPVHLELDSSGVNDVAAVAFLKGLFAEDINPRLSEIRAVILPHYTSELLFQLLNSSPPSLRLLHLFSNFKDVLQLTFSALGTCPLQDLCIDGPSALRGLLIAASCGQTLTRLVLTDTHALYDNQAQLYKAVVKALRRLPRLETLEIKGCLNEGWDASDFTPTDASNIISLPKLRSLLLDFSFTGITLLLHRIRIPPDARLFLTSRAMSQEERADGQRQEQILSLFRTRAFSEDQGSPFLAIQTLEFRDLSSPLHRNPLCHELLPILDITERDSKGLVVLGWREDSADFLLDDYNSPPARPSPDIVLAFPDDGYLSFEGETLGFDTILPALPLLRTRSMSFQPTRHNSLPLPKLLQCFESCASLRWLRVDRAYAKNILRDFFPKMWVRFPRLLPDLKDLALLRMRWRTEADDPPEDGSPSDERLIEGLWEMRKSAGIPLSSIIVGEATFRDVEWGITGEDSGVMFGTVELPDGMDDEHPDWDDDIAW